MFTVFKKRWIKEKCIKRRRSREICKEKTVETENVNSGNGIKIKDKRWKE